MKTKNICKVCSGEYHSKGLMFIAYQGIIVTHDMYTCPKCGEQYPSGSYASSKEMDNER